MSDPLEAVTSELLKIQLEGLRRENSDLRNQVLAKPAMPSIAAGEPANGSWSDFVAKTEAELAEKNTIIERWKTDYDLLAESARQDEAVRIDAVAQVYDLEASVKAWSDRANDFEDKLTRATAANAILESNLTSRGDELTKAYAALDNRQEQVPVDTSIEAERLQAALEMAGKENQLRRQMIAELQAQLARQPAPFAYPGVELVGFTVESIPFIDVRLTYDLGQTWSTILQVNAGDVRFVPRATARDIEIIMSAFQVDESDVLVADEATVEAA